MPTLLGTDSDEDGSSALAAFVASLECASTSLVTLQKNYNMEESPSSLLSHLIVSPAKSYSFVMVILFEAGAGVGVELTFVLCYNTIKYMQKLHRNHKPFEI
jgi:hypothetical protein